MATEGPFRAGRCVVCVCGAVCVCGESVESAMECQLLVCDEFSAVSLRGTMLSAMSVLLDNPASGGKAGL